ncbi:methyltransferase domain-containing protein [Sphaerisporangium fuscum]|uniref:methyltransferase domain-containing protein n=1 Tax=Sphaerisporangium fuscum TaxID=2835868 RepID=UPI001BDC196D|nr:methyltransferase domain-containing protein [Sphaerisporangium fuscum]
MTTGDLMAIDFHSESNRLTYAGREAGDDWARAIRSVVSPEGGRVVDVGCGGGVYCKAWLGLGAASVVGVDFSAAMLSAAREYCEGLRGVTFRHAGAYDTGLPDAAADIVFERALIHHLDDLGACFREARRLLAPGGTLIVQDRTIEDVTRPGTPSHLRGYFFERFPELLETERARRPAGAAVEAAMREAGFRAVRTLELAETRREYAGVEEVRADLLARTGRSILHELNDAQLEDLAAYVCGRLDAAAPVRESDHWTLWVASV